MADWAQAARAATAPAALVTILATEGSAPRGAGTRMLVTANAAVGTIGGGALEWQAAAQARAILPHPPGSWRIQDYPLGPLLGQCCGGRVRLLVERLGKTDWIDALIAGETVVTQLQEQSLHRTPSSSPAKAGAQSRYIGDEEAHPSSTDAGRTPASAGKRHHHPTPLQARGPLPTTGTVFVEPLDTPRLTVMLFGAGHVGRAIARMAADLPAHLAWFDSRPETDTPGLAIADPDALVACASGAPADAAVLILTHDHALDYRLAAAALGSPARFVGLIGSATKRARFLSRLAAEGVDAARLTCPIGAPGIPGKEPGTIALAALAQLLALRTAP